MSAGGLGLAGLWLYVRRSLRRHALVTGVTVLSTALGAGLVLSVLTLARQSEEAFAGRALGFDAVLGARSSPLQLVLNAVFHLETSPGNVPWSLYEELAADPRVLRAVPYAVGDSYRGFRIVATTPERFAFGAGRDGEAPLAFELGRPFDPERREAVLGCTVATRTGLRPGDSFAPQHGVATGAAEHDETYTVVGLLASTGGPLDNVVWIPLEGMFRMGGHTLSKDGVDYVAAPGAPIPAAARAVSAVLVKLRSYQHGLAFDHRFNKASSEATFAWPVAASMRTLFERLGWGVRALQLVAGLVVVVAAASILASLYASLSARRQELAVLRALGARRRSLFAALLLESGTITLFGALLGFAVHALLSLAAADLLRRRTGVALDPWSWQPAYVWVPLGLLAVGLVAGVVPGIQAYRNPVASEL